MRNPFAHVVGFLLSSVLLVSSQASHPSPTPPPAASQLPQACNKPEFRQFDFWLGTWLVKNPEGKEIGRSEIAAMAGGCAIRETWKSSNGITGISINFYDASTRHWHQHWVGSDGSILHLEGGLQERAMVLSGPSVEEGRAVENKISWTPLADGKVEQKWTTSADGGTTWKSSFVGIYER